MTLVSTRSIARRVLATLFAALLLSLSAVVPAAAALRIDITRGKVAPVPLAIPDMLGDTPAETQLGADIARVVTADLERSGLFQAIPARAFIQKIDSIETEPRFADWRVINAHALVTGKAGTLTGGQIRVQFRLWDVFAQQQMVGKEYTTTRENWRRIAHIIADEVYRRVTGEDGYFDTRVVYVAESGPANKRVKRIAVMDQDGENHRFLTDGQSLVLTPRFSPTAQEVTYLSFVGNRPRVYLLNIETGQQEVLGDFAGMTFAPRFSPDGSRVVMSLARGGDIEIFSLDLKSRQTRQLTNSAGIDTSPSYSPDGRQIVFNSDRGGSQQLYVMDADGGSPRRISFGRGRYATPVWSPRGDLIAFTKMDGGQFFIGVMRPDGSGERLLTQSYLVEGPTWAPNGRVLMYFRQDAARGGSAGATRIYSIDLTGDNERLVVTPTDASDPAWSPLIP